MGAVGYCHVRLIAFGQVPQDVVAVAGRLNQRIEHGIPAASGDVAVRTAESGRNPGIRGRSEEKGVRAGNGALQEWKTGSGRFLAPVKVLASLFRRRFLKELASLVQSG